MKKPSKYQVAVILLCLTSFSAGYVSCLVAQWPKPTWDTPAATWIPAPRELQKIVGVKADGIIGPRTVKAWEEFYVNQSAMAVMEKAYEKLDAK